MKNVTDIFKALADPIRLRILLLLRRRELCVCEIMYVLGMEQSRVSHQLSILRSTGLAEDVREGRWVNYRIPDASRPVLESLFAGPLRERIDSSPEAAEDARRLESCIRENIRGRVCGANPRGEGR
jgi:ArsR family transcriptional regulator